MSIAVSAVVGPSRRLRVLLAVYGFANVAAAFAVGLLLRDRFMLGALSGLGFLAVGTLLLGAAARATKTRQIDISGLGHIRLQVQQGMGWSGADGEPVSLLAGSTVWPQLMVLRLGATGAAVTVLPVLRDSVTATTFRVLAVAVGTIGGRNDPIVGAHKIL
jgi:toxin CptA